MRWALLSWYVFASVVGQAVGLAAAKQLFRLASGLFGNLHLNAKSGSVIALRGQLLVGFLGETLLVFGRQHFARHLTGGRNDETAHFAA